MNAWRTSSGIVSDGSSAMSIVYHLAVESSTVQGGGKRRGLHVGPNLYFRRRDLKKGMAPAIRLLFVTGLDPRLDDVTSGTLRKATPLSASSPILEQLRQLGEVDRHAPSLHRRRQLAIWSPSANSHLGPYSLAQTLLVFIGLARRLRE